MRRHPESIPVGRWKLLTGISIWRDMTDRIKGLVITFVDPMRAEEAEAIQKAICQLRGVATVDSLVDNPDDHVNRQIVIRKFTGKILDALRDL